MGYAGAAAKGYAKQIMKREDSRGVRYKEVTEGFKNPLCLCDPLVRRLQAVSWTL